MILKECTKRLLGTAVVILLATSSFAQITSGKVVYERKTNLQKLFKDNPRVKNFINEDTKYRIEDFVLYLSDEPSQGMMKYLTTHNKVYQNWNQGEKIVIMDMWGQETFVKDSIAKRQWKITESKRKLGGYMCRKAVWEMNDTTRLYAWFSPELVPSVGPEGFTGLPGTILGFATEDGSIIYFAKEVEAVKPPEGVLTVDTKGKDVYTKTELKATLLEKMGKWVKEKDLDAMFAWI